jgi:hypothetical protein
MPGAASHGARQASQGDVFELGAILAGTNIVAVLHSDDAVIERARQAVRERLTREGRPAGSANVNCSWVGRWRGRRLRQHVTCISSQPGAAGFTF